MIQSAFLGVRRNLADGIVLEVNALHRAAVGCGPPILSIALLGDPCRHKPDRPPPTIPNYEDVDYLSNQGPSDYAAFTSSCASGAGV